MNKTTIFKCQPTLFFCLLLNNHLSHNFLWSVQTSIQVIILLILPKDTSNPRTFLSIAFSFQTLSVVLPAVIKQGLRRLVAHSVTASPEVLLEAKQPVDRIFYSYRLIYRKEFIK